MADFTGTPGNDSIVGTSGDDVLEGGLGDDTLDGGGGSDTATYSSASGAVQVDLGLGTATGAAGNDTLVSIENLVGSGFDDALTGDSNSNSLSGGLGNDTLIGGGGNDFLDGGVGGDYMVGGAGDDVYIIDQAGDGVTPGDGVIEALGEGTDEIRTTINWGLGGIPDVENLTALGTANIFLGGNDRDNVLTGNGGNNYFVGEGGNDSIDGGGNVADGSNSGKDIASYQLPAGTVGTLVLVEGTGADAGKLLVQLVDGGSVQTVLKVTVTGQGSAIVTFTISGLVQWRLAIVMAVGSTIGGHYASRYAQRTNQDVVRQLIGVIGIVSAIWLFVAR